MNPLHNYEQWKAGKYSATVDEWEDWAERIVETLRAELNAAKKDFDRIVQLEAENEAWKAYYRDATELAEAVSMSGNMRISPSDKIKMSAMKARLDALLTGADDETVQYGYTNSEECM